MARRALPLCLLMPAAAASVIGLGRAAAAASFDPRTTAWPGARLDLCMSLSDEQVSSKLRSLRRKRRPGAVRANPAAGPSGAEASNGAASRRCEPLPAVDSAAVWEVPEPLRLRDAARIKSHGGHASLEDLFPGSGLAARFDEDAALRRDIRTAMRADLFVPPADWPQKRVLCATGLGSSLMVAWRRGACETLSGCFSAHGVQLRGDEFVSTLGALCGADAHGSLIDIVPNGRSFVTHSWHQDSGLARTTVLLGFPPENNYQGGAYVFLLTRRAAQTAGGVFSHSVQLSHPLVPSSGEAHGAVVEFEQLSPPPPPVPEECVLRPSYARGREVWLYVDAHHLHSAPDRQRREALWRFM